MLKFLNTFLLVLIICVYDLSNLQAQNILDNTQVGGQFFFSYEKFLNENNPDNRFNLKRGYINVKKELSDRARIRFTQDVSVDNEGDGRGNIELRVKYALVNIDLSDAGILQNNNFEIGVVRRPWIDFEQSINRFRSQDAMFMDLNGIVSSADYGVTIAGDLGDELSDDAAEQIRSGGGNFGSFALGIYNGGGYSAIEENNNKVIEGRISLRPLSEIAPGFQTNLIGAAGKGNIEASPDFRLAALAFTYESEKVNAVLQGFKSEGDTEGNYVTSTLEAISLKGWSFFTGLQPFDVPVSLTLRYDEVINNDINSFIEKKAIAGIGYIFENGSKLILDVDRRWNQESSFSTIEVVTEIRF